MAVKQPVNGLIYGIDLIFVNEAWLSVHSDETKVAELASNGFDMRLFPRLSRSGGLEISTI